MARVQLRVQQHTQGLFCQATFQPGSPQHVLVPGVVPPQGQDVAFPFGDLHEVPASPFLQPGTVPLTRPGVSAAPLRCASPAIHRGRTLPSPAAPNKDAEPYWPQRSPPGYATSTQAGQLGSAPLTATQPGRPLLHSPHLNLRAPGVSKRPPVPASRSDGMGQPQGGGGLATVSFFRPCSLLGWGKRWG